MLVLSVLSGCVGGLDPQCTLKFERPTLYIEVSDAFFEGEDTNLGFEVGIAEDGRGDIVFRCREPGVVEVQGAAPTWDGETDHAALAQLANCNDGVLIFFANPESPVVTVEANQKSGGGVFAPEYEPIPGSQANTPEGQRCNKPEVKMARIVVDPAIDRAVAKRGLKAGPEHHGCDVFDVGSEQSDKKS